MYVHIGKDVIIEAKSIIAIFDTQTLQKKNSLKNSLENICKNLKINDKIVDVSDDNPKTLIITNKNNKTKGYISNISSITLGKRTSKYERMENNNGKI